MPIRHLAIEPRDGLFLKDGRGWFSNASGNGRSLVWPMPSTIRGALRAGYGRGFEISNGQPLDPAGWETHTRDLTVDTMLALRRVLTNPAAEWAPDHRMWPVPADAYYVADSAATGLLQAQRYALRAPKTETMGRNSISDLDQLARENLWRAHSSTKTKHASRPGWWTNDAFVKWLCGEPLAAESGISNLPVNLRMHVGIDAATFTNQQSLLYATETVEFVQSGSASETHQWAIGVRLAVSDDQRPIAAPLTVGGKRMLAGAHVISSAVFEIPQQVDTAFEKGSPGLALIVVAPTEFERGWLPDGLASSDGVFRGEVLHGRGEWILRSAIISRPMHASGWDMSAVSDHGRHGRPKRTSRLVPPGSVYFFVKASGQPFDAADARALWLCRLGQRRDDGFGCAVPGIWNAVSAP